MLLFFGRCPERHEPPHGVLDLLDRVWPVCPRLVELGTEIDVLRSDRRPETPTETCIGVASASES